MFRHKKLIIAFVTALVAVSVLAVGIALADTPTPTPQANSTAKSSAANNAVQSFLDKLAANLGIERATLDQALTKTRDQTLDEAVKNGKMTQEQADKIKQSGKNGILTPGFLGGRFGFRGRMPRANGNAAVNLRNVTVEALAQITGKSTDEITQALKPVNPLQKFLSDNNISQEDFHNAVVKVAKDKLDQAVKDGKLTQDQADKILQRIQQAPSNKGVPSRVFPNGPWNRGNGGKAPATSTPTPSS